MTTYYVGGGGSNANAGTSWALRKADLNGAEDVPVVAGDTVVVGAGTYREFLTCDVSGSSGNPITYVADVDGHLTDGVGGVVRVTGSDNDQTSARTVNFSVSTRNFRTFRGFMIDMASVNGITGSGTDVIFEDCVFGTSAAAPVLVSGSGQARWTFRRCLMPDGTPTDGIQFTHTSTVDNAAHVIENCVLRCRGACVASTRVGGITVNHCTLTGGRGVRVLTAITVGQFVTVNNCIICGCSTAGVQSTAAAEVAENYNTFFGNTADRTTTSTGANSIAYPPLFAVPVLLAGYRMPLPVAGMLSFDSPVKRIAGTSMSSDTLYGMARPATDSKKSWGAVQYPEVSREVTTVRTGAASLRIGEAGRHQVYKEATNASTTVSVYVRWETDYTGTKPQMVIKQPGQSDITITATGSAGSWELLTNTWTPAASPGYIVIELVSNNTATSGSFAVFFDDLVKS